MNKRQQRMAVIAVALTMLGGATLLTLNGLKQSVSLFYAPADLAKADTHGRLIRLGGLVQSGSVARQGTALLFTVTDGAASVSVRYQGDPPDLFRENQGVVAEGRMQADGSFTAERVLAKHDENYMPREVAKALQARGEWRGPALDPAPAATGSGPAS